MAKSLSTTSSSTSISFLSIFWLKTRISKTNLSLKGQHQKMTLESKAWTQFSNASGNKGRVYLVNLITIHGLLINQYHRFNRLKRRFKVLAKVLRLSKVIKRFKVELKLSLFIGLKSFLRYWKTIKEFRIRSRDFFDFDWLSSILPKEKRILNLKKYRNDF